MRNKSHIFIGNALIDLMREKPYNKITVRDIADWAYISRATFYNHFQNPDDVLQYLLAQTFDPMILKLKQMERWDTQNAAAVFAESVTQSVQMLSVLRDQELIHRVPQYILQHLKLQQQSLIDEYQINAMFYGTYGIAVRWPGFSASDIADIIIENRYAGISGDLRIRDWHQSSPKRNKRTEQTLHALHTALCLLMRQKPLYSITVGELTKQANVGRSSFYRHYQNLEQVVHDALCQSFLNVLFQESFCDCSKAITLYTPSRILFRSVYLSGKELDGIECLYRTIGQFTDPLQDDIPWTETLRRQAHIWCTAVNHVIAVLLYFQHRTYTVNEFLEMIK